MSNKLKRGALCALSLTACLSLSAQATLIPRLNGQAVYNTDLDVTWIADPQLSKTQPYGFSYTTDDLPTTPGVISSVSGLMKLETAYIWLQNLNAANYLGFNDWRLPTVLVPDASCVNAISSIINAPATGLDCTGSELGHLYNIELQLPDGSPNFPARNLFTSLGLALLSGTEYTINDPYILLLALNVGAFQLPNSEVNNFLTAAYGPENTIEPDLVNVFAVRDGDVGNYPVSNPGIAATVHIGDLFTLDGSASTDPDGHYPLTYNWSLVSAPAGSTSTLSDPALVNPAFTPDQIGDYVFELVVNDSLGLPSAPMQVTYSTYNTAPVADAGPDQVVVVNGSTVQLDGSQSYDDDGDTFTAAWGFTAKPSGSTAALSDNTSLTPTFTVDAFGTYDLSLTVTDSFGAVSSADSISISFANVQPVANPGVDQTGAVGDTFVLDGSGSSDANNDLLNYDWSFTTQPMGSNAVLSDATTELPSFTADVTGTYIISLLVNDGLLDSVAETVSIEVADTQLSAVDLLDQAIDRINAIPRNRFHFKHRKAKRMLTRTINRAISQINGDHHGHYHHGQHNICRIRHGVGHSHHHDPAALLTRVLARTDGCVNNGSRDRNDWIKQCDDQVDVYNLIMDAIDQL